MADFRAVAAVCDAVMGLLESAAAGAGFDQKLQFQVLTARQLGEQPITAGVSLFLYRVLVDGTNRSPAGRLDAEGRRTRHKLPLDLHFILSVWGGAASLQHRIAGWMIRVLEDHPILPAGLLNRVAPDTFRPEETVELVLGELSTEDLLRLWENLAERDYRLSIPYLARVVWIESTDLAEPDAGPVQQRRFDLRPDAEAGATPAGG